MAGFTRLLNSVVSQQSGLQSADSRMEQIGATVTSTDSQSLGSFLSNAQNATINSRFSIASSSALNSPQNESSSSALSVNGSTDNLASPTKALTTRNSSFSANSDAQIQTSQQLLDSVAQEQNTTNAKQRQEAYKTLLSATRQIAQSTSDAGIRSAAQNFEAQLTQAYQYGNQQAFQQSANQTASSQLGYVSNQDMRTLMDNSPFAMQKAIETFGSAEAAQNALFHSPAARSHFAQALHEDMSATGYNDGQSLPLATIDIDTMARPHRQSYENELIAQFDEALSANQLDTQIAQQSAIGDQSVRESPNVSQINRVVNQERESIAAGQQSLNFELYAERGTTMSAKSIYEEKQSGLSTVLGNAYLGGALYNSPTEYKERLKNQSEKKPEIKNSLNELGQREKVRLSDFEKSIQKSMK